MVAALLCNSSASGQGETGCESQYQVALTAYEDFQLPLAAQLADSLSRTCRHDRDQMARIVFLQALIAARLDSMALMKHQLERLFRNDRNFALKPYDPLLIAIPQRDELYTEYQLLFGSRELGPGKLRKDHGLLRAGFIGGAVQPQLDISSDRLVFAADGPFTYTATMGWCVGAVVEFDAFPNWAVRVSTGLADLGYEARNTALRYEETMETIDLAACLRKAFWLGRPGWVPYLLAGGGAYSLRSATVQLERSGDGVRLLAPYSPDRIAERAALQYRVIGGLGVAYKLGHVVLSLEGRYEHGLTDLIAHEKPYTESEMLVRYYYVDNDLRISTATVALGVHYVIKYHARNRFYR